LRRKLAMKISVESVMTRQIVEVDVWPSDTVGSVKEVVCNSLMISPYDTMLTYNGKPLHDDSTMAQAGIVEGSTLQLMLSSLIGGWKPWVPNVNSVWN
jgi:hypothetical protein